MARKKKRHLLSFFWGKAVNAAKRAKGPISAGYDPKDLEPHIFVNGKTSPSIDQLVREVGFEDAWQLLKDSGAAYGVNSDRVIAYLERNG